MDTTASGKQQVRGWSDTTAAWPELELPGSEVNGDPTTAGLDGVNLEPMLLRGRKGKEA